MGHTVVLGFDDIATQLIHTLMGEFEPNKIPFGRNCDREAANKAMDYHMTLYHWPKSMDEYCLSKITGFQSVPCEVIVNRTVIVPAEENSWLLYFEILPTDTFRRLKMLFETYTGFSFCSDCKPLRFVSHLDADI